ncbi:MAG TPA: CAP domain-containing protein, partial [Dehalococcoidales bacterium]|nr:CAP domain-containing protein [Dehalococcoidales bacterium]
PTGGINTPPAAVTTSPPVAISPSVSPQDTIQPATTPLPTSPSPAPPTVTQPPAASPLTTPAVTQSPTPVQKPSPSPTPTGLPFPTVVYKPAAAPYIPSGQEMELVKYVLQLINKDRADHNVPPVELAFNAAAQKHAQDMFTHKFLAHWGTDGLKPYMRYTLAGGFNLEGENAAYSFGNVAFDVKTEIAALQWAMVYDDAASNWGHRDTMLNRMYSRVSIGLVYDANHLALVQQFESDFVEFFQPPTLNGNILSLSGQFKMKGLTLNNAAITFDKLPQPLTAAELKAGPYHSYGLGPQVGWVFPPPPPGATYANLPAGAVVAGKGLVKEEIFWLEADISTILTRGPGVYTACLIAVKEGRPTNFTNYSIIVK